MTRFRVLWMYMACTVVSTGQAKFWGDQNNRLYRKKALLQPAHQAFPQRGGSLVPDTTRQDRIISSSDTTVNDHTKNRRETDGFKEAGDSQKSSELMTPDEKSKEEEAAASTTPDAKTNESAPVGVKAHHKKSNAVGDPDDGSDDSDDDSELDDSEWEELEDELEAMSVGGTDSATTTTTTQVQVEVELVEDGDQQPEMENMLQNNDDDEDGDESNRRRPSVGGGGVGLRLGQRLQNHRRKQQHQHAQTLKDHQTSLVHQEQMLAAWQSYVYAPPSPEAWTRLKSSSRVLDGASKVRLDRRTLYSGLLLEWKHASATYRKFLEPKTSQALQAALSMATQPQWRRAFPRPNAIRLYDTLEPNQGCTLAMQEMIAMALAHSLGAGVVILDDKTLSSVRQQLLRVGFSEQETKPGILIQSLLSLAREGRITARAKGSIAKCMERDLQLGLDDPFDERATDSCKDMAEWEESWSSDQSAVVDDKPLPLVIFVRAQASNSLLKSKSAVETLLQECNSRDSTNLVILGKGIDSSTVTLPKETVPDHVVSDQSPEFPGMRNTPGAAPWFGFSPHNQNASGQNDPEGSRRFNIFLARTVDPSGAHGILGAIAPPEAGNLFPHMMAMQARERLQHQDDDSPIKAELERWAQMLQQQMQTNGGMPLPPPQFFNASLSMSFDNEGNGLPMPQPPPPEVIQETLQQAMSELLDRLAQMSDGEDEPMDPNSKLSPNLHKAFAQVLRNESLRRGIAQNLSRAAPALSDPKCQGVMLSVYVPPPANHMNSGKLPDQNKGTPMGGWFQKILNGQEDSSKEPDAASQRNSRQRRTRTMAAAAAVLAAKNAQDAQDGEKENKADRNLARLESLCRPVVVQTPSDPVRGKSWDAWISRERGAVIFRHNRRVLNDKLEDHLLSLQEHTGTRGAGSSLRQMLSVRDISNDMDSVIKCAIELEAAKSQLQQESPHEMHEKEACLDVDITLSQLLLTEDGFVENTEQVFEAVAKSSNFTGIQFLHPSSLEAALSTVCRISPSPSGGLSLSAGSVAHRSRDEISALAQDKHERALVSQVVSPQDIGVTYDMIGGLTDVKELLRQSITYPLKFPHLYSEGIAREAVRGVLLFGPPGTGKTMLAKAVATEGGASFLSVDASSVENKWLGESEKNAKAVFTLARRLAPCVIFIDEVDSLLSSREGSSDDSAHGTLTSVKTTMMSEWDGLNSGTNGNGEAGSDRVVVIGSTNRPFDLDEAVLRRFPRRILVDLPDLETRKEILEVTLAENRLDPAVNLTKIAERLDGYTGSDIKEVCREAVVQISHEQARLLDQGVFNTREDVTQGSLQRLRPVTPEDFERALGKLKRSVSDKGKELARVWEWNDEYGEIKREKRNHLPHLANMYL